MKCPYDETPIDVGSGYGRSGAQHFCSDHCSTFTTTSHSLVPVILHLNLFISDLRRRCWLLFPSIMSSGKRGLPEDTTELPERKRTRIEDKPSSHSSEFFTYPSTSTPARLGHPVHFQKPQSLLTFSYSPSRVLEFNDSALRYYVDPPRGANLRYGYDRWIRRPEEKGRLDGLLRSLIKIGIDRRQKGETSTAWLRDIGVVSWRGVMTK